ncbi:MAG: hypothetical protein AAGD05_12555, partial [Bacteroidota bacterium]
MKRQVLYILLFFLGQAQAQITLTNAYFPQVGDTLRTAIDAMPNVSITPPGGNQTWDYSILQGLNVVNVIRPASDGANSDQFPNADLLLPVGQGAEGGETYANLSDNEYQLVGYAGPDPANLGIN